MALLAQYDSRIPTTFFGIVALVAGLLVTFLPETSSTPLPDTIEVGPQTGFMFFFWHLIGMILLELPYCYFDFLIVEKLL